MPKKCELPSKLCPTDPSKCQTAQRLLSYINAAEPGKCSAAPARLSLANLEDVLLHRGIATGGGRSSGIGVVCGVVKVVGHLRVELLRRLLDGAVAAATLGGLLGCLAGGGTALGTSSTLLLDSSGRLGLNLGGRDALGERLGLGNQVGRSNDNLNLDRRSASGFNT